MEGVSIMDKLRGTEEEEEGLLRQNTASRTGADFCSLILACFLPSYTPPDSGHAFQVHEMLD
jgi:hypothetical protein